MNKSGLVLKVEKRTAFLVTGTGEFVKVSTSLNPPKVGETYTGAQKKVINYFQHLTAVISIVLILIFSGSSYLYYTSAATLEVAINPSIDLRINCFDRIIKTLPLNNDGKTLLMNINLINKNIDDGLTLIIKQAKEDNFINNNYIAQGKTVFIKITSNNSNKILKLSKFQKYADLNKIKIKIVNNLRLAVPNHVVIKKQALSNDTKKKTINSSSLNNIKDVNTVSSFSNVKKGKNNISYVNKNSEQNISNIDKNSNQNTVNGYHNIIPNNIPTYINKDSNSEENIFTKFKANNKINSQSPKGEKQCEYSSH